MFGQTFDDSRSNYSGVHSEKQGDVYTLQLVAFHGPEHARPYKVADTRYFQDWNEYRLAYDQTIVMLEQALAMGR